jgi:serine/threonine-protein kinase
VELVSALSDRYDLERELGSGGAATVYLARDLKHERRVAIKVLHPDLKARGYHPDRFLREIRIVANLTHPNILPLHDSDECGGHLFYVMPYIDGETLRHRLRREHRLAIDDALRMARAVASALDYAHRHDVLHRDVKPENILLHEGQPLVADFGVARAISICCDEEVTDAGFVVGTPAYMSPEQASGDIDLDGRSDIYGLACMLYEMLAGRVPFEGSTARETIARQAIETARPIRELRPEVPPNIDVALVKALAKDPADRYASAAEFGTVLRAAPAAAASSGTFPSAARAERAVAVLPFENVSPDPDNEYFSDGISDELINALAKVKGLRVTSRTSAFALKGERRDVRALGASLGVTAVIEGTVRKARDTIRITARLTNVIDGSHLWSEHYDRKLDDVFAVQDEIAQNVVGALRRTILAGIGEPTAVRYAENVEAYNLYLKGRYHWNRRRGEHITRAIEYFEQAIALDAAYAPAYAGLADCHSLRTDYRGAPVAGGMERAKAEARKALELDESLAEAHTSLAWVTFIYDWQWADAERAFTRALELHPGYATAHQWYAWLLLALGRFDEARAEAHAAVELDPVSVSARRTGGWLELYTGDVEAALPYLTRAVEMDPTSAENHRVLGRAHFDNGLFDEAERSFREAIALSERADHSIADLGRLHAERGERPKAEGVLRELLQRAEAEYISPVPLTTLCVALGDVDRALHWLHRAYDERRGWLAYLQVERLLDPLRDDARFTELLRKMNLGK